MSPKDYTPIEEIADEFGRACARYYRPTRKRATLRRISDFAEMSQSSLGNAVQEAVDRGYVTVISDSDKRNTYEINPENLPEVDDA